MNKREAEIYFDDVPVGILSKQDDKYYFTYHNSYLSNAACPAISLTLPKQKGSFVSDHLFPFFFGLLAEGDNKELQCRTLKIDEHDHFTRLLKTAVSDTIGGITVREL